MRPDVARLLRCPICHGALWPSERALRCDAGHAFDVARQGYVSFLTGRPTRIAGDDAAMIAARARFLLGGHLAPLADAIASAAAGAREGLVVEVGAGTAYHLGRVLDALPSHLGLAVDVSRHAARRAARAHPRAAAIVADARAALPLADGSASVVLDVFAPREARELRRILADDGRLLVATPLPEHLVELREPLGLVAVDPEKERRLAERLGPGFRLADTRRLSWRMTLARADVLALASMGPSARHVEPAALARRVAALADPLAVTAAVRVDRWAPRPPA